VIKEKPKIVGGMNGAFLDPKAMLVSSHLALVDHRPPFALAPLEFLISAPRELPVYA
jgi:hypothetical protein